MSTTQRNAIVIDLPMQLYQTCNPSNHIISPQLLQLDTNHGCQAKENYYFKGPRYNINFFKKMYPSPTDTHIPPPTPKLPSKT